MDDIFSISTPYTEVALRFGVAALAGAVLGFERELRDRNAGLRTHMLIALAAAAFTVVAIELASQVVDQIGDSARPDPLRIVEAVTAGVAFLGAGAIIQGRGGVHGLTTAAGMWLAGAIGMAAGAGFYGVALLATLLGVIVIVGLRVLEACLFGTKGGDDEKKEREEAGG